MTKLDDVTYHNYKRRKALPIHNAKKKGCGTIFIRIKETSFNRIIVHKYKLL